MNSPRTDQTSRARWYCFMVSDSLKLLLHLKSVKTSDSRFQFRDRLIQGLLPGKGQISPVEESHGSTVWHRRVPSPSPSLSPQPPLSHSLPLSLSSLSLPQHSPLSVTASLSLPLPPLSSSPSPLSQVPSLPVFFSLSPFPSLILSVTPSTLSLPVSHTQSRDGGRRRKISSLGWYSGVEYSNRSRLGVKEGFRGGDLW